MVSATPGLTAKWLVPRIYRFLAQHPEIDTRISASVGYANFTTDGVDVGIRLSSACIPTSTSRSSSDEWMLPLCSPRLLEGERPLRSPHDLPRFPLIQIDLPGLVPTWDDWLRRRGHRRHRHHARPAPQRRRPCAGCGERGGRRGAGLQAGRLARHRARAAWSCRSGRSCRCRDAAYHFVCAKGQEKRPTIKAFRDWLFAEIEETFADAAEACARRQLGTSTLGAARRGRLRSRPGRSGA